MGARPQVAIYWGAACGGCDVSVLDTDEFVLDLAAAADLRFWPIAIDARYRDVEAMADGELDLALYSGAVRNDENEGIAKLLRRKSRTLVAFGSCAYLGGIPALANLGTREELLSTVYLNGPSREPGPAILPKPRTEVAAGSLELPVLYRRAYRLADVVPVDYAVPGCPPARAQVRAVLDAFVGGTLPPPPAVVGAGDRALCDECPKTKGEKRVTRFYRPHEIVPDPSRCLLEQGLPCAGPATRAGCGARCQASGMPCRGCYGPAPGVADQGAKFLSALASIVDADTTEEIDRIIDGIPDLAGCVYRFSAAASAVQRSARP